jgi:hypothetical protein
MTKSSSGFASLCWSTFGRAQTSLFHYVPFIHWLPSPDFRIRSIQMGCDLYIHFRTIRDVFSTNFSVVVLCFLFLFGFDSKHPVGSRYPGLILDSICALLRASQLPADLTVVCTRSGVFQWVSRPSFVILRFQLQWHFTTPVDYYISEMGDWCHLDKWFRTIGPCVFDVWIWQIQQMKKRDVVEDSEREHSCGCTPDCLFV